MADNMETSVEIRNSFYHKILITDNPNDCWGWNACSNSSGYPCMTVNGKDLYGHRVSYQLFNKIAISNTIQVRHKCDNRICCNPRHLILGTNADNMADRDSRNRQAKGSKQGNSLLTDEIVLAIRKEYDAAKRNGQELGRKYGVRKQTIFQIVHRKTWKHI